MNGADPNIICKNRTPLYLSVLHGDEEIARTILQYGGDPNITCGCEYCYSILQKLLMRSGICPIHLAASKGLVDLITLLALFNADLNVNSAHGTPLHVAAKLNHRFIAKELLERGATLDKVNAEGDVLYFHVHWLISRRKCPLHGL